MTESQRLPDCLMVRWSSTAVSRELNLNCAGLLCAFLTPDLTLAQYCTGPFHKDRPVACGVLNNEQVLQRCSGDPAGVVPVFLHPTLQAPISPKLYCQTPKAQTFWEKNMNPEMMKFGNQTPEKTVPTNLRP